MTDVAEKWSKKASAMERLAVDLAYIAEKAVELSEALKQMVVVVSTAERDPDGQVEITEAGELVGQKGRAFAGALGAFVDPSGRTMRDMQAIRNPADPDDPIQ